MRPARIVVACSLASLALALPGTAQAGNASSLMFQKINQTRARYGLAPLRSSPSLSRSSNRFASWLMAHDTFGHRGHVSASHRFKRLGEALALHGGSRPGVRSTLRQWLSSSAHRAIVLSHSMRWMGASMCRGRFGRHRAVIWVLQVGKL